MHIRSDHSRHLPRAAAVQSRGDGEVWLAPGRERHGETLHRARQASPPQLRAGLYIYAMEDAIEVAHEGHAAAGREYRREKRSALGELPDFFQGSYIICRELADIPSRPGHLKEAPVGGSAARAGLKIGLAPEHLHAGLAQRNDELSR